MQKAFDTVDHEILVSKLNNYGIRGVANDWLKSYLTERNQIVSIDGFKSHERVISCGIPQGSTLGPLLFLIYINDLHKSFQKCSLYHFADDTNIIIISSQNLKTIETVLKLLKL